MQNIAESLSRRIFEVSSETFHSLSLEVFQFQYEFNPLYRRFCELMHKSPGSVKSCSEIPFLPISFFKHHEIKTTDFHPAVVFESSRTTGLTPGRHNVKDLSIYEQSFLRTFELFYGTPQQYCFLGLLPSYLEREGSSLVYMVNKLCTISQNRKSGFYLHNFNELAPVLAENNRSGIKTILLGVTYALIDFAEAFPMDLGNIIVMETGGMKGRKQEMLRETVHEFLKQQWQLPTVHSEYGMTELMSQAYSSGGGLFSSPPWMKVLCRQEDDPLDVCLPETEAKGAANIIDLANLYSCAFIATDDLVHCHADGSFKVEGRLDHSDMRGCSLLFTGR